MSFLVLITDVIALISFLAIDSCWGFESDGVNHTPKYLTGLWFGDGKTVALSEPMIMPSEGESAASPLMIISSDLSPLILISLRMKNSLEILIVLVKEALEWANHEVSSKNANADIREE